MNWLMRLMIAKAIENDLMSHFPGPKIRFVINPDGTWNQEVVSGHQDFYHKYPGMSREQADQQILDDIMRIIKSHYPQADLVGYEQHGKYHRIGG